MSDFAAKIHLQQLPNVSRNNQGTPLVSSIFELARQNSTSPLMAYVNADILLTPEFISLAKQVSSQVKEFLIVGQRWDLDVKQALDFNQDWIMRLLFDVKTRGRLHPPGGSDYFIFPRDCYTEVPRFAIGRAGWDNWMFYHARLRHWPVIDVSSSLTVVHQDHDYSHLPGGQPHYQMPESFENIHLAGGRRTIFTLLDADYKFHSGKLQRIPLCHPLKAFGEWRGRLAYKINK
jgi:hypothetical protein